jgi:hypothetical protein
MYPDECHTTHDPDLISKKDENEIHERHSVLNKRCREGNALPTFN